MASWFVPVLGYLVLLGLMGVTAKLALRTVTWQELVLWVPIAYAVLLVPLALTSGARFPLGAGGWWAALTAFMAAGALVLLFYALTQGDASRVVPASSAYPVITLVAAAIVLAEPITVPRVVGTMLVVSGVVLLTR